MGKKSLKEAEAELRERKRAKSCMHEE